jgi:hypothetical protein
VTSELVESLWCSCDYAGHGEEDWKETSKETRITHFPEKRVEARYHPRAKDSWPVAAPRSSAICA